MPKRTFEQMYSDLQRFLERRAKAVAAQGQRQAERQRLVNELGLLAVRGKALADAGNLKEARAILRKAQALEKKLGISSRKR